MIANIWTSSPDHVCHSENVMESHVGNKWIERVVLNLKADCHPLVIKSNIVWLCSKSLIIHLCNCQLKNTGVSEWKVSFDLLLWGGNLTHLAPSHRHRTQWATLATFKCYQFPSTQYPLKVSIIKILLISLGTEQPMKHGLLLTVQLTFQAVVMRWRTRR